MVINSVKHKLIIAMVLTGLIGSLIMGSYNIYENIQVNANEISQYRTILYEQFDRSIKLQVEIVSSMLQDVYDQQQKRLPKWRLRNGQLTPLEISVLITETISGWILLRE